MNNDMSVLNCNLKMFVNGINIVLPVNGTGSRLALQDRTDEASERARRNFMQQLSTPFRSCHILEFLWTYRCPFLRKLTVLSPRPVSYTHLDVYKRQHRM